ncbi:UNVERIFIED_ORG: NUDIX domain-containing protein [Shinella sp. XGS7]|nr:NUDIX domain-containing protein [Shinella sp. XGS7]
MEPNKACPVVARVRDDEVEVLAFRHPLAGLQLVKGTIESGETASAAAVRELAEEAGLAPAGLVTALGVWQSQYQAQVWSFHLVPVAAATPEAWEHYTHDGGGHIFSFFWHPLRIEPTAEWHPLFQGALMQLRALLNPDLVRTATNAGQTYPSATAAI